MPSKTGFIDPQNSEFGLADFPINTKEELCNIARAINAGFNASRKRVGKIENGQYVNQEVKQPTK